MSKVILITGSNQGIGYEMVRQLAQKGHIVYLNARTQEKGKEALAKLHQEGLNTVKFLLMDVSQQASVDAALKQFSSEQDHLDVLINNAGINIEFLKNENPPTNINIDLVKETYEVNLFGVMRVTNAFLPLVEKSSQPNIVMVSSGLGSVSQQADPNHPQYNIRIPGYNSSKSALNSYSSMLAASLAGKVKVNVITPGYTATNLNNFSGTLTAANGAAGIIDHSVLIGADGPHGQFLTHEGKVHPW